MLKSGTTKIMSQSIYCFFSSVLERSQCLPIKCITCIWMFIQMCLWSCPSNLKYLKLVLDSNVSTMEMHLSSLRIWYRVCFTCTISCVVFTAILGPQTWLISKYYILLQCILWFSRLPLPLRKLMISYIKMHWPLRPLINSGSLEGLWFFFFLMVIRPLLSQKTCQLKGNTGVNSCVIFIHQKLQAHLAPSTKKKKKSSIRNVPVHLNIACVKFKSLKTIGSWRPLS